MTVAQTNAIAAAIKSARHTITVLEDMKIIDTSRATHGTQALLVAIATGQIACAREVSQYSANERADIARLDADMIVEAIVNTAIPE